MSRTAARYPRRLSEKAALSQPHDGLVVDGLARRYGPRWAVARVSLDVPRGSACQLTGPNGSGKSTLLKCIATALRPHEGSVSLGGVNLWTARKQLRRDVAFLSHESRLYEDLSAQDNLRIWSKLGGIKGDIPAVLDKVGLEPSRRDPVSTFSAGMRRRLALAVALLKQPRLLLLDEPFSALDPEGRQVVTRIVSGIRDAGAVVVLATHLPEEAQAMCDRRLHLEGGRTVSWETA